MKSNKRSHAMATSLALWRFAEQMDKMEEQGVSRTPAQARALTRYTFWFATGPRNFHSTDAMRALARKIAIGATLRDQK